MCGISWHQNYGRIVLSLLSWTAMVGLALGVETFELSSSSSVSADDGLRSSGSGGQSASWSSPTSNIDLESSTDTPVENRSGVQVGYKNGFYISSRDESPEPAKNTPFFLRIAGWGQLRNTHFSSDTASPDLNQFQLKRARLIFSGRVFTPDFAYYAQIDGRSTSGDEIRLLDYYLTYDLGHHCWGLDRGVFGMKAGRYKMPNSMARYLSGRKLEFADRSMASTYFDVNRSLGWGLWGSHDDGRMPLDWEVAIFNGLVTGGAETGSTGALDDNFAFSGRLLAYPTGEWGASELADLEMHDRPATRVSASFANSVIDRSGRTEFNVLRVADSGEELATLLLPLGVDTYRAHFSSVSGSFKWKGWSGTCEYYFRTVDNFGGANLPSLLDHGHWLQLGKFVVPQKFQLLARWSRVVGNSGTLGQDNQSSDEIAGGFAWYFRGEHAKLVVDASHLNGAPINSSALDIARGDAGWLVRTQIQFAF